MQPENVADRVAEIFRMSFLSILTMILSFVAGLFAVRELKIFAKGMLNVSRLSSHSVGHDDHYTLYHA